MRNERYRKNAISVRERHNERKNEVYSNPDVLLEYSHNNVTFKACEAATYVQQFDRMVEEGVVSTRGLKPDAYVFDELVFDVNTDYFETHGGYAYAKQFYAEVYELAKEIAGGEQYIISAVMHADERNREASDRLGRDVFHYHLHVVYLPVVEKQIRWSKRCKDPALRGTVRDTIMQVSHSKKVADGSHDRRAGTACAEKEWKASTGEFLQPAANAILRAYAAGGIHRLRAWCAGQRCRTPERTGV